jgi:hypothetical protein
MDWWAAACFQQTHGFPEECVWLTRCVSHQFIGMSVSTQEMMNSEVLVKGFGRNEFINVHQCSSMFINVHPCSSMFINVHQCSSMFINVHHIQYIQVF